MTTPTATIPGYDARSLAEECRALAAAIDFGGGRALNHAAHAFGPVVVDEYLRSFAGTEGVLGSMGIYRAAFASIEQTEPGASEPEEIAP